jgi:hypothetical protein
VPVVDRRVELHTRIGALPRRLGNLVPEVPRPDGPMHRAVCPAQQMPLFVVDDGLDEVIGDADRVVGVLARDRCIGLAVEVSRVASRDQSRDLVSHEILEL